MNKKRRYMVYASETIYYAKEVDEWSKKRAMQKVQDGKIQFEHKDITDGENFEVTGAELTGDCL